MGVARAKLRQSVISSSVSGRLASEDRGGNPRSRVGSPLGEPETAGEAEEKPDSRPAEMHGRRRRRTRRIADHLGLDKATNHGGCDQIERWAPAAAFHVANESVKGIAELVRRLVAECSKLERVKDESNGFVHPERSARLTDALDVGEPMYAHSVGTSSEGTGHAPGRDLLLAQGPEPIGAGALRAVRGADAGRRCRVRGERGRAKVPSAEPAVSPWPGGQGSISPARRGPGTPRTGTGTGSTPVRAASCTRRLGPHLGLRRLASRTHTSIAGSI